VNLIFGARRIDRSVKDPEKLLIEYRRDSGSRYLDHVSCTPSDKLVPEDLAVTILMNSRFSSAAFMAVQDCGDNVNLAALPDRALEETNEGERQQVAELIATVARWPGFAASVATKVLHKKRPRLIPILDNQAIFGAYMNRDWPQRRSSTESVYAAGRIGEALDWIVFDLTRRENEMVWGVLSGVEPSRARIELFDSVWWMYFRRTEPVRSIAD